MCNLPQTETIIVQEILQDQTPSQLAIFFNEIIQLFSSQKLGPILYITELLVYLLQCTTQAACDPAVSSSPIYTPHTTKTVHMAKRAQLPRTALLPSAMLFQA